MALALPNRTGKSSHNRVRVIYTYIRLTMSGFEVTRDVILTTAEMSGLEHLNRYNSLLIFSRFHGCL